MKNAFGRYVSFSLIIFFSYYKKKTEKMEKIGRLKNILVRVPEFEKNSWLICQKQDAACRKCALFFTAEECLLEKYRTHMCSHCAWLFSNVSFNLSFFFFFSVFVMWAKFLFSLSLPWFLGEDGIFLFSFFFDAATIRGRAHVDVN